jgi:hypothetical protein
MFQTVGACATEGAYTRIHIDKHALATQACMIIAGLNLILRRCIVRSFLD